MGARAVDEEREGELGRSEMRNWRQMSKSEIRATAEF